MRIFREYETGKINQVDCPIINNPGQTAPYPYREYEAPMLKIFHEYEELKRKERFYKSWIGRTFFNGAYKIINIQYTLKQLEDGMSNLTVKWTMPT